MNFEYFILKRIAFSRQKTFSRFIISIAIAAVALSITVMIVSSALVNGFQQEISSKMFGFWAHINIVPYSLNSSFREDPVDMHQDFYVEQKNIEGVRHIQVTATKGGIIKTDEDFEGVILKGVGSDFDWQYMRKYLVEGDTIETGLSEKDRSVILSSSTASRLKVKLKDKVVVSFIGEQIRMRQFDVVGIYNTGLEEFDKNHALIDLRVIQDLNNWGRDSVGGFEVFISDIGQLDEMKSWFHFHMTNPKLQSLSIKDIQPNIFDWLNLQTVNEWIILILMIIVATINMVTALLILIIDRTTMIGILKTLGADNWSIRKLFLYNAAYIIIIGLVIGNVVGIGLSLAQIQYQFIRLPEASYYVSIAPIDLNFWWILFINLGTLVICTLFLILPTYMITRLSPVKAIRFG